MIVMMKYIEEFTVHTRLESKQDGLLCTSIITTITKITLLIQPNVMPVNSWSYSTCASHILEPICIYLGLAHGSDWESLPTIDHRTLFLQLGKLATLLIELMLNQ